MFTDTNHKGPQHWDLLYSNNSSFSNFSTYATFDMAANHTLDTTSAATTALANNPISIASGTTGYFRMVGYGAQTTKDHGLISSSSSNPSQFRIDGNCSIRPRTILPFPFAAGRSGGWPPADSLSGHLESAGFESPALLVNSPTQGIGTSKPIRPGLRNPAGQTQDPAHDHPSMTTVPAQIWRSQRFPRQSHSHTSKPNKEKQASLPRYNMPY